MINLIHGCVVIHWDDLMGFPIGKNGLVQDSMDRTTTWFAMICHRIIGKLCGTTGKE